MISTLNNLTVQYDCLKQMMTMLNNIANNSSNTDQLNYRYRTALLEIIDYRYRFSSKRFIVPITDQVKQKQN